MVSKSTVPTKPAVSRHNSTDLSAIRGVTRPLIVVNGWSLLA